MDHRSLNLMFAGALTAVGLSVASASLVAQTAKPAPAAKAPAKPVVGTKQYVPPRTKDGHPDLQGNYDVATVTPMERPADAAGRAVLTKEEAAAAAAYEKQREAKDDAPLTGDRSAPPVGGERVATKTWLEQVEQFAGGGTGGENRVWREGGRGAITVAGETRTPSAL